MMFRIMARGLVNIKHPNQSLRYFSPLTLTEAQSQIDTYNVWTKSNETKHVINFVNKAPPTRISVKDIDTYINTRQKNDKNQTSKDTPAFQMLSSLLTYPLSLSYGLQHLFLSHFKLPKVRILIVGARAESSLPVTWWREQLYTAATNITHREIRFIGPNLQQNNSIPKCSEEFPPVVYTFTSQDSELCASFSLINNYNNTTAESNPVISTTVSTDQSNTTIASTQTVTEVKHTVDDMNVLHNHPNCDELLQWADVFVLYNPGYGSTVLQSGWSETIRLLLHTRKPVLCTAHGEYDLQRDLMALDRISSDEDSQELGDPIDMLIPPHCNPYKSYKLTIDKNEDERAKIVQCNHSIYAFRGN